MPRVIPTTTGYWNPDLIRRASLPWPLMALVLLAPGTASGGEGPAGSSAAPAAVEPGAASVTAAQQVHDLYTLGMRQYNLGDYSAAIETFKQAYLKVEAAELLYDIAQSYRLEGGHCSQALQFYKTYLRERLAPGRRASVEAAIRDMEACAALEPKPEPIPEAKLPSSTPAVQPSAVNPAALTTATTAPRPTHTWVYVSVGAAGLATAVAGGALAVWSHQSYLSLQQSGCSPWCSPGEVGGAQSGQVAGLALLGVGGAALATAVVLWWVGR